MITNPASQNLGRADSPFVDLSSRAERERLSPSAIRGFFVIMDKWRIRDTDGRALLGGVSHGRYYALKKDLQGILSQDELQRISLLVGIFKGLNILYSPELADQWMVLPNSNRLFRGERPLDYVMRGGIPALQTLRRLVDARRGGQE